MSLRLVIFDLDGTILDTIDGLYTSVNKARVAMGLAPQPESQIKSYIGRGAVNLMRQSLACDGMDTDANVERMLGLFNSDYDEHCIEYTKEYPGVSGMLDSLKESGLLLAVNSNKNDLPTQKLISHFFPGVFSYVQGRRDDIPRKPDPAGALACMEQLGCSCDETCYIGDSDVDVKTAMNAGVLGLSVAWGYQGVERLDLAGARIIFHKTDELCRFLQKESVEC